MNEWIGGARNLLTGVQGLLARGLRSPDGGTVSHATQCHARQPAVVLSAAKIFGSFVTEAMKSARPCPCVCGR